MPGRPNVGLPGLRHRATVAARANMVSFPINPVFHAVKIGPFNCRSKTMSGVMFDHLHFGFMIPPMVKTVFLWFLIGAAQVCAQSVIQRPGCSGSIDGVVYSLSKRPAAGVQVLVY